MPVVETRSKRYKEAAAKAITKLMTSSNGSVRNEILSLARKLDLDM